MKKQMKGKGRRRRSGKLAGLDRVVRGGLPGSEERAAEAWEPGRTLAYLKYSKRRDQIPRENRILHSTVSYVVPPVSQRHQKVSFMFLKSYLVELCCLFQINEGVFYQDKNVQ